MSLNSGILHTSLKASLNSLTPIMSAVSASILGPISSTKSSKSTLPPPTKQINNHRRNVHIHIPRNSHKLFTERKNYVLCVCECQLKSTASLKTFKEEGSILLWFLSICVCVQDSQICWLSSMSSISVGMYPIVLMHSPRSLQVMKPSLSLSNSLKASRSSARKEHKLSCPRGQLLSCGSVKDKLSLVDLNCSSLI